MVKKISKMEARDKINEFFSHVKHKTPKEVEKIKKLAMSHNIKLGDKRKLFCKKCLNPHGNSSINIKDDYVNIVCDKCGFRNKWKLKKELDLGIKYNESEQGCC